MRSWVLAASLLAAAATGAQAADLYDDPPPPGRYGSAYDDPRYADIYKYPAPPPYAVPPPRPYLGPYGGPPIPRERVYRENYYERDGYEGPRGHSYLDPRRPYAGGQCLPREVIREQLLREGWHDFQDRVVQGEVVTIHARRADGRPFALAVDRCSGEIVSAEPLEQRRFGPYAYGPGPRRWDRSY